MRDNVKKYLELEQKWSEAALEGDEETYNELADDGDEVMAKFSDDDWKELISSTENTQAKFYYKKMMEKSKK